MPVDSQTPVISYNGNGVTLEFAFTFAILDEADLYVKVDGALVSTGFSVAGVGDPAGGSVTFVTAPASGTGNVVLYREVALERQTDYQEGGDLLAGTLDADLDRVWYAMQDRAASVNRALRAPFGETLDELPAAASRALRVQGYDADGQSAMLTRTDDGGSALALDLLDTVTPGKAGHMVAHKGTATGEVAIRMSAALNLKVKGLKKSFGAAGGGVANDYTAINNAFQASGKIIEIEDDTFLCNTAPAAPICAGIVGFGSEVSKLQAGAGVLKMLSLVGATAPTHLRDFAILGNNTNNARGIIYGDGALTANIHAQRVAVRNYTGTGAIGEYIRDMVSLTLDMCQVSGNTVNRQIEAQTLQPTTIAIRGGVNELAVKQGMKVISASGVTLSDEHIIQTNGEEGLLIAPDSSNVLSFKILGGWVEGNWYSLLADAVTRLTKFQVDATQVSASTIQLIVEYTKFDAIAKSIRLGAGNAGSTLRDVQVANLSGAIDCAGGYGRIGVPGNLDYATVVNDPSRLYTNMYAVDTAYVAWTPTYASDLGNAATTFSGAITTALARAGNIGGTTIHATISGSGTLNAVTPNYIKVSLPSGMTSANNATYSPALIKVGANYETGVVRAVGSDLYFYRANFANYTSAAAIEWNVSLMFEAAP